MTFRKACLVILMLPASVEARPPPPAIFPNYTCPIGEERFEQSGRMQYRLDADGKPIFDSEHDFGIRMDIHEDAGFPECPTNGLPMYRAFTPNELKRLPALLSSRAFNALRKDTSQPIRALWLATQLGDSAEQKLVLILPAVDMAHTSKMRKHALQLVIDAFADVPFGLTFDAYYKVDYGRPAPFADKIDFRMIYIHALREMREFDKALIELRSLPVAGLNGTVPDPIHGPEEGEGEWRDRPILNQDEIGERERDRSTLAEIAQVEQVLMRRDSTPTLFELQSEENAARNCENYKRNELSPSNRAFCEKPSIVARRKLLAGEIKSSSADASSSIEAASQAARDAAMLATCRAIAQTKEWLVKMPNPVLINDPYLAASDDAANEAKCAMMAHSSQ